jgi:hypothetical protein
LTKSARKVYLKLNRNKADEGYIKIKTAGKIKIPCGFFIYKFVKTTVKRMKEVLKKHA